MTIKPYVGAVLGSLVVGALGCGDAGSATPEGRLGTATRALEEGIPRVQNPPPASDLSNLPGDLRAISVPKPPNLGDFVKDEQAAIALGKALFWDMQVGSDGKTACASCHFRAGADPRSKNQLSPGLKRTPDADLTFTTGGPNHQLQASDFPLTRLAVPGVRGALDPATDSNDVVSSQGVHWLAPGLDPQGFGLGFVKARRVEPRNTPSVINAVFNHRQFWDGRAESVFNGVNPFGTRDPDAKVFRADDPRNPVEVRVELANSSLASQAVGPIVSDLEMAAPGRTPLDVGRALAKASRKVARRMEKVRPLALQQVDPTDSVLGPLSRWPQPGLDVPTYNALVKAAFHDVWWRSRRLIQVAPDGTRTVVRYADDDPATEEYTLLQYNFSLFFGIAIQMYEATLVSDDTPWDRFRREHPAATDPALNPWTNTAPNHISRQALFGAHLFNDRTRGPTNIRCSNCHESAELTDASVRRITAAANGPVRNRDGNIIDKGFNNIGLRPTSDDLGVGASDVFGPLSHSKRLFPGALPATFDGAAVSKGLGVEGAFKVPSLRNVALTAPYFHNGDARTLHEAVELYSRGGNVAPVTQTDGTPIEPLGVPSLKPEEVDAIVAWLEALTDERVLYRRAPFDHPQLFVPNGHPGDGTSLVDADGDGFADDALLEIPAVGAAGGAPLPGFLEGPFGPQGSL
ncbi:cytochrome-c peroxidase [Myxococcus sp. RHSTA-1-4]|uniref:cytochrome-c peroxidase n=1 Tax=Myxococcus sp. RHSTA-1-4 TaxID=2874601 RepID=UPI00272E88EB|nr:cytochrome c peroxidase [Myxococcus sp. RHSTA-1-4]MBZ4418192.1 cytochrome-c peroxidase [Myxococcus sp. RHSTA-1-4]